MQLHARSPIDFRPLYRRDHPTIPKALGLFGATAVRLHELSGQAVYAKTAEVALDRLSEDVSAGTDAWGYPFDTQTRWGFSPAGNPNVVVTAFGALALLEGAEALGRPEWRKRADRAGRWVLDRLLLRDPTAFAYHPGSKTIIHNASLLGARLVHATAIPDGREAVDAAVRLTLSAQRPDGSWPYGEGPGLEFVDGFHTGYVLDCLLAVSADHPEAVTAIERGARYYTDHFFGPQGEAWLWPDRRPEDAHAAGTGLGTLAGLVERGLAEHELLERVAERVITHTIRDGHAVCRRWGRLRTTVRYIRWCDAHVALGLASAAGHARAR
jgi:hypothetical protein